MKQLRKFIATAIREHLNENITNENSQTVNEGDINYEKEKSWKIKDQFPIEVKVHKSWTGMGFVIIAPAMKMSYEIWRDLDMNRIVDISTYDYENGNASFISDTLDNVRKWGEKNKDRIIIDYSEINDYR